MLLLAWSLDLSPSPPVPVHRPSQLSQGAMILQNVVDAKGLLLTNSNDNTGAEAGAGTVWHDSSTANVVEERPVLDSHDESPRMRSSRVERGCRL